MYVCVRIVFSVVQQHSDHLMKVLGQKIAITRCRASPEADGATTPFIEK